MKITILVVIVILASGCSINPVLDGEAVVTGTNGKVMSCKVVHRHKGHAIRHCQS